MKIEDELKELILSKYRTMQNFADKSGVNYQTLTSIIKRGVANSSIANVIKICQELGISADELGDGRITYVKKESNELNDVLNLLQNDVTLDGELLTDDEIQMLRNTLEIAIEMIKRKR